MSSWPGDQGPGYGDPGQQGSWDSGAAPGSARERIQPPPAAEQPATYQQPGSYQQPQTDQSGYPGQYGYAPQAGAQVQPYAQPYAQQNAWATPYAAPQQNVFVTAQAPSNGMAVASLVLGITSIVFCWWGLFSLLQVVLAIVFGCVALSQSNRAGGRAPLAIAGIVCASAGFICYLIIGIFTLGIGLLI
jgi:hypothetical protein